MKKFKNLLHDLPFRCLFQLTLAAMLVFSACNQNVRKPKHDDNECGSGLNYYKAYKKSAEFRKTADRIERFTKEYINIRKQNAASEDRSQLYIIPVVIHVVWTSDAENISIEQIQSQIDILNRDYRALHPNTGSTPAAFQPLISDPRIEFRLAVRDPSCNPTNGIVRVHNTAGISLNPVSTEDDPMSYLLANNPVKQLSPAWPRDKYLNIWVCRFTGTLNGYSTFPGSPANVDGVVIRHGAFGNIGTAAAATLRDQSVTTHEVGHWLNLRHIWGDDDYTGSTDVCAQDDDVDDTPLQGAKTPWNCPTFPHVSCSNGPNGDMFMNYMDYSDCRYIFSIGQAERIEATLNGERAALLASDALIPPTVPTPDLYIQDTPEDMGNEPNNESALFYVSEDIWVRNSNDGIVNQLHQNPVYKSAGDNYVYIRIRNRSCGAAAAVATVRLYWAKASSGLAWPTPWDGSIANMGHPLGSQATIAIPAGGSQILAFNWHVPNPDDYAAFGDDKGHFCLLARIETAGTAPYGMTSPETGDLWLNVKNNNNIAWKNVSVMTIPGSGSDVSDYVLVANYTKELKTYKLDFRLEDKRFKIDLKKTGRFVITMDEKLFEIWYNANKELIESGKLESTCNMVLKDKTIYMNQPKAFLDNIKLRPGEFHVIKVSFEPNKDIPVWKTIFYMDMIQVDKKLAKQVGGQRFIVQVPPLNLRR